jgi:hypothetical protein
MHSIWPRITASVQHHIAMQHVQMWLQHAQRPDVNLPFLSGAGAATSATRASVLFTGWAVTVVACVSAGTSRGRREATREQGT